MPHDRQRPKCYFGAHQSKNLRINRTLASICQILNDSDRETWLPDNYELPKLVVTFGSHSSAMGRRYRNMSRTLIEPYEFLAGWHCEAVGRHYGESVDEGLRCKIHVSLIF
jgi:hypothetical protein